MNFRTKAEVFAGILVLGFFFWTNRTRSIPTSPNTLKPHEAERVVFNDQKDTVSVVTHQTTETYVGIRHAQVSVSDTGKITVTSREYGFCFEPGLGISFRDQLGLAGDIQWFYYHRFGVHVGIYGRSDVRLFFGAGYNLSRLYLSNTSLVVGFDNRQSLLGLVRVRF